MSPVTPKNQKAQSSLHSFFKRKAPSVSSPTKRSNDAGDIPIDLTDCSPPAKRPRALPSTEPLSNTTRSSQPASTSSYFSRSSATAKTASAITESTPTSGATSISSTLLKYKLPKTLPAHALQSGTAFNSYLVFTEAEAGPSSSQQARTQEQILRHERWTARMLQGGIIRRRRSLALDEAAAAELRRGEAGNATPDLESGSNTPAIEDVDGIDVEDEHRRKAAEGLGSKLAAMYAAKDSDGKTKGKGKGKKKEELGPSGLTYTPLEKQYMEIKEKNQDVLLLMEVGYKYKFHGDDAKIAGKELGIVAFPSRNFYTASIPTHRLHIHVKKLISLGYKVGVISQTETAALKKVGDNRNAPFTRELTHLFTAATYVEDPSLPSSSTLLDDPVLPGSAPPPTNALVAIVEQGLGGIAYDERARIALVSVIPSTGEVVWDEFDDSQIRTELETRLTHLAPAELLLPKHGLSKPTQKVLNHYAGDSKTGSNSSVRIERLDRIQSYNDAFENLTSFYQVGRRGSGKNTRRKNAIEPVDLTMDSDEDMETDAADGHVGKTTDSSAEAEGIGLASGLDPAEAVLALVDFPKQVVVALSMAVNYMKTFGLENAFRHRSSFGKFINRAHMLLSSNTLVNLEIYRNQDDGGIYGSLLWRDCKTRMGRRLLREWIGRPLLDVAALRARTDAIEEIMGTNTCHMEKLRSLLVNMPDLVKGLTRVQYGKATPTELATLLVALTRIGSEFKPEQGNIFRSVLLNNILKTLPSIKDVSKGFLDALNLKAARENDEADLWADPYKYPDIQDAKDCISICESELDQHLKDIRKTLKRPSLNYVTVAGIEFLVEVPVRDSKSVPPKWVKISATKSVNRYHTPDILRIAKEREQHKETLSAVSKVAFRSFQSEISEYHELVVVSKQIAVIDCLMSLAQVAAASGYCKPTFVAEPQLQIKAGRHPMVEMLREEAYVPFDIGFSEKEGCAKVITGPNMAGKSSCVRAVALIVCMAQIGSFVPASSVTLGVHDAVQTRMGASDEIGRGKSTFMVELSETSDILRTVTPRSLVILDELGRGTSTYDGVAIAYATLSHIAGTGCNTLFVTHYPMVAEQLAREKPKQISNWHMSFDEIKLPDGSAEITFLYKLTKGLAEASFGVWCARLAGLPKSVLETAQIRADYLKHETQQRLLASLSRRSTKVFQAIHDNNGPSPSTSTPVLAVVSSSTDLPRGSQPGGMQGNYAREVLRNVAALDKALRMMSTSRREAGV
ncbi:DNA mismatch repair protein MSH3 [Kwoniella heveanensis BCC8398]|uniref:DNA mismatch repair protein MSH3 n=1 Tax=Kwoniella heveanensis BCC8398 TaxID=1296120 RepID=A0A1B9GTB8_9TREE|nr:DNA mismatch repair protein MSH3 [Kwoniella heveanensis BCC8398]